MPKSDWVKYLALGLAALFLTLFWSFYYVGSKIGERNYHSASYERHASDKIRSTCLSGEGGDVSECITKVIKATNEDQRAQDDLVAQTEMATWAFWMLIATIVVTGITGLGVFYIWLTLKATQEMSREAARGTIAAVEAADASKDANSIIRQEQRPWVLSTGVTHGFLEAEGTEEFVGIAVQASWKNFGKSPAV